MIYISGKISGLDLDLARLNFEATQIKLAPGVTIHPFEIKPLFGTSNWLFHMIPDIWELLWCDSIYILSNYKDSKGARIELFIAKITGKEIYYESNI